MKEPKAVLEFAWQPLSLPSDAELAYSGGPLDQLESLAQAWAAQKAKLQQTSPDNLREFTGRLVRSWAIETGILERLYDLDAGATKTLIEHGFRADFVERNSTSMDPELLVRMLRDHQAAADMVLALVAEGRPLYKHFLRELHQLLTRNQLSTQAVTPTGTLIEVPLLHGEFKKQPNNPQRPDGSVHEYCPPEQVESQIDQLLEGLELLDGQNVALRASWLHHRFTQIHPFQDGNGRVARALSNYVFIKADLFPLVVHRSHRVAYIEALEKSDRGDLIPLVDLSAEIQARTIIEALSVAKDEEDNAQRSALDLVVAKLAQRFGQQIQDRQSVLRSVNEVALRLRDAGAEHLTGKAETAVGEMNRVGMGLRLYEDVGGLDRGSEHWWKAQLVTLANEIGYWLNFAEGQYWIRVAINYGPVELRYVASLHHVGHDLSGIMRAAAFAEFEVPPSSATGKVEPTDPLERLRRPCTPTLFSITWQSDFETVLPSFKEWLEESFAMALRYWMDLF